MEQPILEFGRGGGARMLHGNWSRDGVLVTCHDGRDDCAPWVSPTDGVFLCLNLEGKATVRHRGDHVSVEPGQVALIVAHTDPVVVSREPSGIHRYILLQFRREYLVAHFAEAGLPYDGRWDSKPGVVFQQRLTARQEAFVECLAEPPVAAAALPIWWPCKVAEAVAEFFFPPAPEPFSARQKRLNRERVERVCQILRKNLTCPPTLAQLAGEIGVSQFYLSRMFSRELRTTITQFVRRLRMERAAEMLRQGGRSVTEVSAAMGYSSRGHFSQSFAEVMGCCPTHYGRS